MRIITGELRGRRLEAPYGDSVRPTSDKVKESIFNMLMGWVEDAVCIDAFAGTGNLGLEAISRGAKKVYFFDSSRDSIKYIKNNISYCKVENQAVVLYGDGKTNLKRVTEQVDVIFMDPPYEEDLYIPFIEEVCALDLLAEDGIIVAEHDKFVTLPDEIGELKKIKEKKYGRIMVSMYARKEDDIDE